MTRLLQYLIIACGFVVIGSTLLPVNVGHRGAIATVCLSNLKQIGTGIMIYEADFDDRMPPRDAWIDATYPYTKRLEAFHCPNLEGSPWGYAFNGALDRKRFAAPLTVIHNSKHEQIFTGEAASTPLVYDSVTLLKNASDLVTSLPAVPRHRRNNIVYADGHAKAMLSTDTQQSNPPKASQ